VQKYTVFGEFITREVAILMAGIWFDNKNIQSVKKLPTLS